MINIKNAYISDLTQCSIRLTRLLRAAEEALTDGSDKHLEIVKEITEDHLQAAKAVISNPEILQQTQQQIEKDCRKLRSFLQAAEVPSIDVIYLLQRLVIIGIFQIIDEISPRSRDIIVGIGEKLSCTIAAAVLKDKV